ncbi:unnamed protein product [Blepharisma stoltei]|uniref:Uncharacterized protein n=1 Tax=Blepharisma stoltei TaxID=1481888 RepID=A0AAU9K6H7_9CILI|nr:unnamed protein product [Blepharisma stoltei]
MTFLKINFKIKILLKVLKVSYELTLEKLKMAIIEIPKACFLVSVFWYTVNFLNIIIFTWLIELIFRNFQL